MHPILRLRPATRGAPAVRAADADDRHPAAAAQESVFAACRGAFAAALIQICQQAPIAQQVPLSPPSPSKGTPWKRP